MSKTTNEPTCPEMKLCDKQDNLHPGIPLNTNRPTQIPKHPHVQSNSLCSHMILLA